MTVRLPLPSRLTSAVLALGCTGALAAGAARSAPAAASGAPYASGRVVVGFAPDSTPSARAAAKAASATADVGQVGLTRVLRITDGASVPATIRRLNRRPGVRYAVPDYVAHAADLPPLIPNDPGSSGQPGGWQGVQWNFDGKWGVNAPQAWAHVAAAGAPGGRGVTIAVLDTGVAYANHPPRFVRSPDFTPNQFVRGYDFVGHSPHPDDHNGHGTHVAGTIAEATNNGVGLTGLAYGARIMPVRVLNSKGEGDASNIAAGVIYAARHGAKIINLSLEFSESVTAHQIPELITAVSYARKRGVLLVGASGNEGHASVAYPARAPGVMAVGATTEHGCLSDFSNGGRGLDLVAPGGGADADLPGDPNCGPLGPAGRDVFQVTYLGSSPRKFGLPSGYEGTSMATPHVSATAALIIASRVLGPNPTPDALAERLKATARQVGSRPGYDLHYGWGLIDAAAATDSRVAPGPPSRPTPPR